MQRLEVAQLGGPLPIDSRLSEQSPPLGVQQQVHLAQTAAAIEMRHSLFQRLDQLFVWDIGSRLRPLIQDERAARAGDLYDIFYLIDQLDPRCAIRTAAPAVIDHRQLEWVVEPLNDRFDGRLHL